MFGRQLLRSLAGEERPRCGHSFLVIGWSVLLTLALLLAIDQSESVITAAVSAY